MRKYNKQDHQSIFNTSCASDLQSSMMSSMGGQKNLQQNLDKIYQLRFIFQQTLQQERELDDESKILNKRLINLKQQLERIIVFKFGVENNCSNLNKFQPQILENQKLMKAKIFKPGSITKINRNKSQIISDPEIIKQIYTQSQENIGVQMNNSEKVRVFSNLQKNIENDNTKSKNSINHKKSISNLNIQSQNFDNESLNQKFNKHNHKISLDFKQYKNNSINIWKTDQQNIPNISNQNEAKIKKSYLSSPRNSALIPSPINLF